MQAQKLTRIKLANSVKVGTTEGLFFQDDLYEIMKEGYEIVITERKSKKISITTIFNSIFWEREISQVVQPVSYEPAQAVGEGIVRRRGRPPLAGRSEAQS
jgi:hypothetical protein